MAVQNNVIRINHIKFKIEKPRQNTNVGYVETKMKWLMT